jgi:hypothetical protein
MDVDKSIWKGFIVVKDKSYWQVAGYVINLSKYSTLFKRYERAYELE